MGDKTRKLYTNNPKAFKKKRSDEVTKFYRTAPTLYVKDINREAKNITAKIGIVLQSRQYLKRKPF